MDEKFSTFLQYNLPQHLESLVLKLFFSNAKKLLIDIGRMDLPLIPYSHTGGYYGAFFDRKTIPFVLKYLENVNSPDEQKGFCDLGVIFKNIQILDSETISESKQFIARIANKTVPQILQKYLNDKDKVFIKFSLVGNGKNNMLDNERFIYKYIKPLLTLQVTPGITRYIVSWVCDSPKEFLSKNSHPVDLKKYVKLWNDKSPKGGKILHTAIETTSNSTLRNMMGMVCENIPRFIEIMFQIYYTLHQFNLIGVRHNDLHDSNIFIEKEKQKLIFFVNDTDYYILDSGWVAKVFDFDRSVISLPIKREYPGKGGEDCLDLGECSNPNPYFDTHTITLDFCFDITKILTDKVNMDVFNKAKEVITTVCKNPYFISPESRIPSTNLMCRYFNERACDKFFNPEGEIRTFPDLLNTNVFCGLLRQSLPTFDPTYITPNPHRNIFVSLPGSHLAIHNTLKQLLSNGLLRKISFSKLYSVYSEQRDNYLLPRSIPLTDEIFRGYVFNAFTHYENKIPFLIDALGAYQYVGQQHSKGDLICIYIIDILKKSLKSNYNPALTKKIHERVSSLIYSLDYRNVPTFKELLSRKFEVLREYKGLYDKESKSYGKYGRNMMKYKEGLLIAKYIMCVNSQCYIQISSEWETYTKRFIYYHGNKPSQRSFIFVDSEGKETILYTNIVTNPFLAANEIQDKLNHYDLFGWFIGYKHFE